MFVITVSSSTHTFLLMTTRSGHRVVDIRGIFLVYYFGVLRNITWYAGICVEFYFIFFNLLCTF